METAVYTYEYCNDDKVTIEIDPKWAAILQDLDRQEYNNSQTSRRHQVSLEAYDPEGNVLIDKCRAESLVLTNAFLDTLREVLTERQLMVLQLHYMQGWTMRETAAMMGVSDGTVKKMSRLVCKALRDLAEGGAA